MVASARRWLAYVVIELPDWISQQVKRAYRRCFGIGSYRQFRRLRIITTCRNPAFRFFVMGFGLLLVTILAQLRWLFCHVVGRGRPRIDGAPRCQAYLWRGYADSNSP